MSPCSKLPRKPWIQTRGAGDAIEMSTHQPVRWNAIPAWYRSRSRAVRWTLCLLASLFVGVGMAPVKGFFGGLGNVLRVLSILPLFFLLPLIVYRWLRDRLLWKVRNRLILICVLMGLAPLVMFATLGGVALYLLAGQFSTTMMLSDLDLASTEVLDATLSGAALRLPGHGQRSAVLSGDRNGSAGESPLSISVLQGDTWKPLLQGASTDNDSGFPDGGAPRWLHAPFHGIVEHGKSLYLCSEVVVPAGKESVTVLGSRPLNRAQLGKMTHGLGAVTLFSGFGPQRNYGAKEAQTEGGAGSEVDKNGAFDSLKGSPL